jgi:hypothetical protein
MLRTSSPKSFVLICARFRSSLLSLPSNSGSHTALYPFTLPGGNCIEGRSPRAREFEDDSSGLEERMSEGACVPLVVDISADICAARGLEVLAGEESEWLVSGVRPFASEAARFWLADCEP